MFAIAQTQGRRRPTFRPMKRATVTNRLLDWLPSKDQERFLGGCEPVELAFGEILAKPREVLRDVYFPTGSFISLVLNVNDEASLEVALVGNEGMFGAPLALGIDTKQVHAVVQGPGRAWRMNAARFTRELSASRALRDAVHKYLFVRVSQLEQTAGCNRFHVVEQRLARYLLMTADRSHSDEFHITHEFLAYMLGVRRVGVTRAATALRSRKLIRYSRGDVTILDRKRLIAAACGCYRTDLATYNRIFS
jgi:CRP-like cAMP-binding protein